MKIYGGDCMVCTWGYLNPWTGKEPVARKGRTKADVVTFIKDYNSGLQ